MKCFCEKVESCGWDLDCQIAVFWGTIVVSLSFIDIFKNMMFNGFLHLLRSQRIQHRAFWQVAEKYMEPLCP